MIFYFRFTSQRSCTPCIHVFLDALFMPHFGPTLDIDIAEQTEPPKIHPFAPSLPCFDCLVLFIFIDTPFTFSPSCLAFLSCISYTCSTNFITFTFPILIPRHARNFVTRFISLSFFLIPASVKFPNAGRYLSSTSPFPFRCIER